MLHTYRKWIDTDDVFYLGSKDEEELEVSYYCVAPYYQDSFFFAEDFINKESIPANWKEKLKFKLLTYTYDNNRTI